MKDDFEKDKLSAASINVDNNDWHEDDQDHYQRLRDEKDSEKNELEL